jgi:putative colanic acid biosynthesis acetyltransferase WcaF
MPLVTAPITLGERVWIAADVFVAPGVTIVDGAVVTARSSVFSDIASWTIAAGNPAKSVKRRELLSREAQPVV